MKIKTDKEKLREILVNFYDLTNMRFVIFDDDFNMIIGYPEESRDYCALLKRNPESKAKCKQNDKDACKYCKKNNELYIYKCHAGLFEAVAPIKMDDIILGYIMFGQICEKGTDKTAFLDYGFKYTDDSENLAAAVKKIVSKSEKQIKSAAELMKICACYLCLYNLIRIDEENLIYHLSNYIDSNIATGDLTVEEICSFFNLSRSKLYEISHRYYGMSIAKYIRKKRIEIAKNCLSSNDGSVSTAAERAGFYDPNYFSKVFKAELGLTPREFKKLVLQSN